MKNKNINISDFEINFNLPNDLNNTSISDFLNDWYELTKKRKIKKIKGRKNKQT